MLLPDGTCERHAAPETCVAEGGIFQGFQFDCPQFTCDPPGACCLVDSTCQEIASDFCTAAAGARSKAIS